MRTASPGRAQDVLERADRFATARVSRTRAAAMRRPLRWRRSRAGARRGGNVTTVPMKQDVAPDGTRDLGRLIEACAAGDATAFRRIYELQSSRLYAVALRMTRDAAAASDVLHDAMLQAWRRASRFDAALGSGEAWLLSLLRYRAIDHLRRHGRERTSPDAGVDSVDPDPDPLDRMVATDDGARLHACLEALDTRYRRALMLSFFDGLSHSELAAKIGSPLGTVKSWVRRGLLGLKECLSG